MVLIELALTRTIVQRDYWLPGWNKIGQVEAIGRLFLSPVDAAGKDFHVEMPFVLLKAANLLMNEALFPQRSVVFPLHRHNGIGTTLRNCIFTIFESAPMP